MAGYVRIEARRAIGISRVGKFSAEAISMMRKLINVLLASLCLAGSIPTAISAAATCDSAAADSLVSEAQPKREAIGDSNPDSLTSMSAPAIHDDWIGKSIKLSKAGRIYAGCMAHLSKTERWKSAYSAYNAFILASSDARRADRSPKTTAMQDKANDNASGMAVFLANDPSAPKNIRCQFAMLGGSTTGRVPGC